MIAPHLLQELFVCHAFVTILAGRLAREQRCELLVEVDEILSVLPPLEFILRDFLR